MYVRNEIKMEKLIWLFILGFSYMQIRFFWGLYITNKWFNKVNAVTDLELKEKRYGKQFNHVDLYRCTWNINEIMIKFWCWDIEFMVHNKKIYEYVNTEYKKILP